MGFPTQVQDEEQTSVLLESSVARSVRDWLQLSPGRKRVHACVYPWLCFVLVVSHFLGKFLVKAPSLAWLIQGKRRLSCSWWGNQSVQRQYQGVQSQSQGTSGQLHWPLFLEQLPEPLTHLASPPHIKGSLGGSERKPCTSFNLAKGSTLPPGEHLPWCEEPLLSQGPPRG